MKKLIPLVLIILCIGAAAYWIIPNFKRQGSGLPELGSITNTVIPPAQQQVVNKDEKTHTPLSLTISSPVNNSVVTNSVLIVSGKTASKADVFVNDTETVADSVGNFSKQITLDEGSNTIIVLVNDADGNFAEKELTVTYEQLN